MYIQSDMFSKVYVNRYEELDLLDLYGIFKEFNTKGF